MSRHATQWVYKQRGLSQGQRLLLLYLASAAPDGDPLVVCRPSRITMRLEISKFTLDRRISELQEMGLVKYQGSDDKYMLYMPVPG